MTRQLIFDAFVLVFLAVFLVLWGIIVFRTATYAPTPEVPALTFTSFIVEVATLVGATLATATASALGYEIPRAIERHNRAKPEERASRSKFMAVLNELRWPLVAAVVGYSLVGIVVVIIAATKPEFAPQFATAFALSWVGWVAGGFAAALKGGAS